MLPLQRWPRFPKNCQAAPQIAEVAGCLRFLDGFIDILQILSSSRGGYLHACRFSPQRMISQRSSRLRFDFWTVEQRSQLLHLVDAVAWIFSFSQSERASAICSSMDLTLASSVSMTLTCK